MKKFLFIVPILVLGLFAANYYLNRKPVGPEDVTLKKDVSQEIIRQEKAPEESNASLRKFKIAEPSVAVYKAQKRFLAKEDAEVIGETTKVTGVGDFNLETNEATLFAQVDLTELKSDSAMRDSDLQKLFTPKMVTISYDAVFPDEIKFDQEAVTKATLGLEINNIKKDVEFDITYKITEASGNVKGMAKILMSEFGVTPPSLLNVYTVDDEIEIYFDVNLSRN